VVGTTPGWHLARGLDGNVNGSSRAEVNRWRANYVGACAHRSVSASARTLFRYENGSEQVMRDTIAGLAGGLGKAQPAPRQDLARVCVASKHGKERAMRTLTLLIALIGLALPAIASGKDNPGVLKTGKCSNGATWKLKAKNDDARIEVEFEVDQNVVGRRWNAALRRDGALVFRGARVTRAPSGSFSITRRIANPAGADRITAIAGAARGGTCRAAVTV